jgi:hypothetical protein
MKRWKLVRRFSEKNGRKYYLDLEHDYRLAVADYSGTTPDKTDDGILYINTNKRIIVQRYADDYYDKVHFNVFPLELDEDKKIKLCKGDIELSIQEASFLIKNYKMKFMFRKDITNLERKSILKFMEEE